MVIITLIISGVKGLMFLISSKGKRPLFQGKPPKGREGTKVAK